MFLFFVSLYYSMLQGTWYNLTQNDVSSYVGRGLNVIGEFLTTIFGDGNMTNLGTNLFDSPSIIPMTVAFVLALITSIGIVVMAVKGIKRVFSVFFMGVR